jgi:DNA-binding Lrp family transcriptional regulator
MSWELSPLDDVDRGILQLLQRDTRNATAVEMGAQIGVSDGTVRNRIAKLEREGII